LTRPHWNRHTDFTYYAGSVGDRRRLEREMARSGYSASAQTIAPFTSNAGDGDGPWKRRADVR